MADDSEVRSAPGWLRLLGVGAAYAEAGRFAPTMRDLADAPTIVTLGTGLRWQVAAARDMHLGIDAAFSSDDRWVFIQIGERF